jgi:hypothetical protein
MNGRAWAYNPIKKEWYRIHMADAYCKARLCTKAEFIDCWPDLPELPTVK